MEDNRYTPRSVCEGKEHFNIPIYQRLFTWDKKNVTQLLDDLLSQYSKDKSKPYYIGMLTRHGEDLVDGQQRFTVLSLIASVFQDYHSGWEKFKGKLSLKARLDDQEYLESLFEEPLQTVEKVNFKMKEGVDAIKEWIKEQKDIDAVDFFAEYVYDKCTFFIATLPEGYKPKDLNKYFEAMNSTGRNLESHEIVKVKNYLKSMSSKQEEYNQIWNLVADMDTPLIRQKNESGKKETDEQFKDRYFKAISLIDDNFPYSLYESKCLNDLKKEETSGDINIRSIRDLGSDVHNPDVRRQNKYYGEGVHGMLNFPEFLLQVLYIYLNKPSVNVNDFFDTHILGNTVNEYTKSWGESEWQGFGKELLRYRLLFDLFIIRIPNSEIVEYSLDYSEQKQGGIDGLVIIQMQSYLYVDSSSKTHYRWMVPFLEYLRNEQEPAYGKLFAKLQEIDNGIKDHSKEFLNDETQFSYGGRRTVYFLRRLDFYLWFENHSLPPVDKYINAFRFKSSINSQEHLHPQHDEDREGYKPWGDEKHKFGNLFLISSSFNSSQSDDTINTKFGRIKDQKEYGSIESVKLYKIFTECQEKEEKWTIEQMNDHHNEMLAFLKDTYEKEEDKTGTKKYMQSLYEKYVRPELQQFANDNNLIYEDDYGIWDKVGGYEKPRISFRETSWTNSAIFIRTDYKESLRMFYSCVSYIDNADDFLNSVLPIPENRLPMYDAQSKYSPLGWKYLDKYRKWDATIKPDIENGDFAKYIENLVLQIREQIQEKGITLP